MNSKYTHINKHEKTDSSKLNHINRNFINDVSDLYVNLSTINERAKAQALGIPVITNSLLNELDLLNDRLDDLENSKKTISFYNDTNIVYPSSIKDYNKCSYDVYLGECELPIINTQTALYYTNPITGETTLYENSASLIESFVTNNRFKKRIDTINQNSPINAINNNPASMHVVRTLTNKSDINDITLVYTIDPDTTFNLNTITVYPMPETVCSYNGIEVETNTGVVETIKDWEGLQYEFPINNARKKRFRITPTEVNGITVQLKNSTYEVIDDSGTKEFIIGSRLIELQNIEYMRDGYVGIKLERPSDKSILHNINTNYEGNINNIEVLVYNNIDDFNDVNINYIESGTPSSIYMKEINTSEDYVYILYKISIHDNYTSPIIKGVSVEWQ